jgi:hypothetical protein
MAMLGRVSRELIIALQTLNIGPVIAHSLCNFAPDDNDTLLLLVFRF